MDAMKLGGTVLIWAGTLSLVLGTISYGRNTRKTSIGPFRISVREERTLDVPIKVGMGTIAAGAISLLCKRKCKT